MFTGLVERRIQVSRLETRPPGVRLVVSAGDVATGVRIGDSIAINGCCLTVIETQGDCLTFEAGEETLSRTNLGTLTSGSWINVERSLKVGDYVGGHFVTGHIDAVGALDARQDSGDWCNMWFRIPSSLMPQVASKGSVAVDGVSLTVVDVEKDRFSVALIPHTLGMTTLGSRQLGEPVNIETDILAKYVARLAESGRK